MAVVFVLSYKGSVQCRSEVPSPDLPPSRTCQDVGQHYECNNTESQPFPKTRLRHSPARPVPIHLIGNVRKIFIPVKFREELILLPHTAAEILTHRHHLRDTTPTSPPTGHCSPYNTLLLTTNILNCSQQYLHSDMPPTDFTIEAPPIKFSTS